MPKKKIFGVLVLAGVLFGGVVFAAEEGKPVTAGSEIKIAEKSQGETSTVVKKDDSGGKSKASVDYQEKLIEGKLESFEKRMDGQRWAITAALTAMGFIVTLLAAGVAFITFKQSKEYEKALDRAEKAAEKIEALVENTEKLEKQTTEKLKQLDEKAEAKFAELETKAKERLEKTTEDSKQDLVKQAEKQRTTSDLWNQALTASEQKDHAAAAMLYRELVEDYKNETAPTYYNWGHALYHLAEFEQDDKIKRKLLEDACGKYDKSTHIDPDKHTAYYNWGLALNNLSKLEQDAKKKRQLLEEACDKYDKSTQIKPDKHRAYNNWGTVLGYIAQLESDNDKKRELLEDTCRKYDKAIQIKSDYHRVYSNWSGALKDLSELESNDNNKQQLLEDACTKCERAIQLYPNDPEAYGNWGGALIGMANLKMGIENKKLLKVAEEKLLRAEEFKTGEGAYNLACVYALQGNKDNCREWLKLGEESGNLDITREYAEKDKDLESVWGEAWFKAIRWKGER